MVETHALISVLALRSGIDLGITECRTVWLLRGAVDLVILIWISLVGPASDIRLSLPGAAGE